ncbi:MAG: carbohydrate kinase [Saprospiraceae bacterium]|nr:carbohydrate kinase [Saprospiraceae bacterium]
MADSNKKIVCFGEVLWDVYPEGKKLGGAPFNVSAHIAQQGSSGYMISRVGADDHGREILEEMVKKGISTDFTAVDALYPTGIVHVTLDALGKPAYEIKQPAAWDFIQADSENMALVQEADVFVYGSLASRNATSQASLFKLLEQANLKVCDLNIRLNYFDRSLIEQLLESADILKINDEEAELLMHLFDLDAGQFYESLQARFGLQIIIQTLGEKGAEAYSDGHVFQSPGLKIEVVDSVGSGDAFLSAFIHNYLQKPDIQHCLDLACARGAYVATQPGAIPD